MNHVQSPATSVEGAAATRVAYCSLAVVIALYIVGAVSVPPGSLRHQVQTLPLWIPVVLGFRRREFARWAAVPMMLFWLGIMMLIWLFLLGWARIVSGHFFPTEVAMTLVVGAACVAGLITAARWKTATPRLTAAAVFFGCLLLQLLAFRISLLPYIARR